MPKVVETSNVHMIWKEMYKLNVIIGGNFQYADSFLSQLKWFLVYESDYKLPSETLQFVVQIGVKISRKNKNKRHFHIYH